MSDTNELRTLVKKLQNAATDSEKVDILQQMKKEAKITEVALRESKAGLAIGKLRTHSNPEVSNLAKEMVKLWKAEVERQKAAGSKTPSVNTNIKRAGSGTPAPRTPVTPTTSKSAGAKAGSTARTAKSDGVKFAGITGDGTRDKCMEILYDSLAVDSGYPSELILKRAKAIEAAVLANYESTNAQYKAQLRTLFVNLKSNTNPALRESVVSGDTPAEVFAKFSSADMATEERKAEDQKIQAANLFGSLSAHEQEAETDAFQCGRCKQRKCRYRQAQTRSADEPMTTFVTCTNCGNRWKFS